MAQLTDRLVDSILQRIPSIRSSDSDSFCISGVQIFLATIRNIRDVRALCAFGIATPNTVCDLENLPMATKMYFSSSCPTVASISSSDESPLIN